MPSIYTAYKIYYVTDIQIPDCSLIAAQTSAYNHTAKLLLRLIKNGSSTNACNAIKFNFIRKRNGCPSEGRIAV